PERERCIRTVRRCGRQDGVGPRRQRWADLESSAELQGPEELRCEQLIPHQHDNGSRERRCERRLACVYRASDSLNGERDRAGTRALRDTDQRGAPYGAPLTLKPTGVIGTAYG